MFLHKQQKYIQTIYGFCKRKDDIYKKPFVIILWIYHKALDEILNAIFGTIYYNIFGKIIEAFDGIFGEIKYGGNEFNGINLIYNIVETNLILNQWIRI